MGIIISALQRVFTRTGYRFAGGVIFAVLLAFYLMTLPASFTGGRIGPAALQFLDARLVFFSLLMAGLTSLVICLITFLIRQGRKSAKASATSGVVVGALTPILCCSPILPIILGVIAGVFPSLVGGFGGQLQGFIATHQNELFAAAALLLLFALYQNARRVVNGVQCRVTSEL